jgi:hypothetical protein
VVGVSPVVEVADAVVSVAWGAAVVVVLPQPASDVASRAINVTMAIMTPMVFLFVILRSPPELTQLLFYRLSLFGSEKNNNPADALVRDCTP